MHNLNSNRLKIIVVVLDCDGEAGALQNAPFYYGKSQLDIKSFAAAFGFSCLNTKESKGLSNAMETAISSQASIIVDHAVPAFIEESISPNIAQSESVSRVCVGLATALVRAGVGLLVGSPGTTYLSNLMNAISVDANLDVLVATDDQSTGFIVDGFGRRSAGERIAAAIIEDGESSSPSF